MQFLSMPRYASLTSRVDVNPRTDQKQGDWKISGLSFCSPPENSSKPTSFQPIALSEVLHPDTRLPRAVQMNLDYTSPDFVLDNNLTSAADMFSLGLLCIALYNSPHRSPLECNS